MSSPDGRPELRRHPRAPVELPITVADGANRVEGRIRFDTQDMSIGGAFIRSDLLFELGEELSLEFKLPDGHKVSARGRVVRVNRESGEESPAGMGIQFVLLADRDKAAIQQLVKRG